MLNQKLKDCIEELEIDEEMKQVIKEILIFECENGGQINRNYSKILDNLIYKYLQDG